jgi:UDP:flavonoid glycosyltransferase YjiC (YdhE family)
MYIGLWGLDIDWNQIEAMRGWTFVTYEDLPGKSSNVVTLSKSDWLFADVAASVDVVVSKPGYGTISECVANSVPFVYIPRENFAEYPALAAGLDRWGGGVRISTDDFAHGNWEPSLTRALNSKPDSTLYAVVGAEVAAGILTGYMR